MAAVAAIIHNSLDYGNSKWKLFYERDEDNYVDWENHLTFTMLESQWFCAFDNGGEKMICFEQLVRILDMSKVLKIQQTIEYLQIPLIYCDGDKLRILKCHGIIPYTNQYTILIGLSNAERLCKMFPAPPPSHDTITDQCEATSPLNQDHNTTKGVALDDCNYRIRVYHDCFGLQKGIWNPQLYTHKDAVCIECYNCQMLFSPIEFVGHTHNPSTPANTNPSSQECHWGFNSNNWRWYIRLAEDDSRSVEEEKSLNAYLEEIKQRFSTTSSIFKSVIEQDRITPNTENGSFNTSPSMPTPTQSLSPIDTFNKISDSNSTSFQSLIHQFINCTANFPHNGHLNNNENVESSFSNIESQLNTLLNTIFNFTADNYSQNSIWKNEFIKIVLSLVTSNLFVINNEKDANVTSNQTVDLNNNITSTLTTAGSNNPNSTSTESINDNSNWNSILNCVKQKTLEFKRLCRIQRNNKVKLENSRNNNVKRTKAEVKEQHPNKTSAEESHQHPAKEDVNVLYRNNNNTETSSSSSFALAAESTSSFQVSINDNSS